MIEKILGLARERGLSQKEVEVACALSHGRISKWKDEKGEPRATELLRMADLFRVPLRYIVDDAIGDPAPEVTADEMAILDVVRARRLTRTEAIHRLLADEKSPAPPHKGEPGGLFTGVVDVVEPEPLDIRRKAPEPRRPGRKPQNHGG